MLVPVAIAILALVAAVVLAATYWTDFKWFRAIGFADVFLTEISSRLIMFVIGALLMGAVVGVNIYMAYRHRVVNPPYSPEQQGLDRYRTTIQTRKRLVFWLIVAFLGVLAGISASAEWQAYLLYFNSTPFGLEDEAFNMDLSFFAFSYPFLETILGYLSAAVIIGFIAAVVTHYLYGSIRLQTPGQRATVAARVHMSVMLGVFVLLRAAGYWLDRYGLAFSDRGYTFGPHHTDMAAVLPARTILVIISIFCAVLFFANIYFRNAMVPLTSLGLLVLAHVLIGTVWPAIVQQFQVNPNEQQMEREYIQNNIEATRYAYDIDDTDVISYDAETELNPSQLAEEAATIPSVRLVDPNVVSRTFQQTQQVRGFYQFPERLDVDRYEMPDGTMVDTIIAARELDGPPEGQDNWLTRHMIYTHGFGFVAAAGNQVDTDGRPVYTEYDIPPRGDLQEVTGEYEPRIYYGREGAEYVIVDAEEEYDYPLDTGESDITTSEDVDVEGLETGDEEAANQEADESTAPEQSEALTAADGADEADEAPADEQPADEGAEEGGEGEGDGFTEDEEGGQATNRYDGEGGVQLNNFLDRILYAVKYSEPDILLNREIHAESRILYNRDPLERVEKVAPFLTVDTAPYPAVVDGRIQWIVDAYTTSSNIPYSTPIDLDTATADAVNEGTQQLETQPRNDINYIRNSVKATVDAYDGTVTLYEWDEEDPVLDTWQSAFPDAITPKDEISDELADHLRYPEDMFKVQRETLERYHIQDADEFYGGQDFWEVPNDPTTDNDVPVPPYRQTLHFPGDDEPSFSMTSSYVPRGRENLASFMAVDNEPSSEHYGQIRILQLPGGTAIQGPGQMQNQMQADESVRDVLLPLEQGANVTFGNLLTLPFAGGLLYVEPVYVQAEGGDQASYPLLQQVLVGFGEDVAVGNNLQDALNNLFDEGDGPLEEVPDGEAGTEEEDTGGDETVEDALADAADAYEEGDQALQDGDFAAYGEAMERLQDALERAAEASDGGATEDEATEE
ncbi:UPF0182 family membrane protein [Spiractinospora alimapuensis]|uniref:UPF0182 family membrane protein n=1 Tax=Spiractinospora alimapuensis TaxID=2820884 RepID=UPI001F35190F|nr:UPF0182 family protein [Spiractinospora alimapuensis]